MGTLFDSCGRANQNFDWQLVQLKVTTIQNLTCLCQSCNFTAITILPSFFAARAAKQLRATDFTELEQAETVVERATITMITDYFVDEAFLEGSYVLIKYVAI